MRLLVALILLIHAQGGASEPLLVLVHAHRQAILQLLLLRKDCAVIRLLDSVPFLLQLSLHLHDHVVPVPLAAMLHILNQRVADLPDLDAGEDLRNLRLLDSIPSLLEIIESLLQGVFLNV